jgi:hypothetical protein
MPTNACAWSHLYAYYSSEGEIWMASKRGKTNFAIPINGTLAESIEKLNGELRRVLVEDIKTALEGRVAVLLKAKPD